MRVLFLPPPPSITFDETQAESSPPLHFLRPTFGGGGLCGGLSVRRPDSPLNSSDRLGQFAHPPVLEIRWARLLLCRVKGVKTATLASGAILATLFAAEPGSASPLPSPEPPPSPQTGRHWSPQPGGQGILRRKDATEGKTLPRCRAR